MNCNEVKVKVWSQFLDIKYSNIIIISKLRNRATFISRIEKKVFRPDIKKSTVHVLGSYLLHYLTQTSWALFWKGVGYVSEKTTLGLSLLMKFRFSASMGSVIKVWSAAKAHSDIFFFKSLLVAIVPNWNKKLTIKTIVHIIA